MAGEVSAAASASWAQPFAIGLPDLDRRKLLFELQLIMFFTVIRTRHAGGIDAINI